MYQNPRMRRLRNDLAALGRLQADSSVFRFTSQGDPPHHYRIHFQGRGLWRDHGKVKFIEKHHVEIKLGSSYPRTIPELRWLTPIYHPNISEIGMVCLGGYGTHWVPSVQLDELCTMLWDMLRYHNYDIRSPYNRDAALWVAQQQSIRFPTDARPIRDLRVALGRVESAPAAEPSADPAGLGNPSDPRRARAASGSHRGTSRVRQFAERYGRVFGVKREETFLHAAEQPAEEPASPMNSELNDLVAAQSAATSPEDPAILAEPVFVLEADQPDPRTQPPTLPDRVVASSESPPLFAHSPRLPASPADSAVPRNREARRHRAGLRHAGSPSDDEIVFIE